MKKVPTQCEAIFNVWNSFNGLNHQIVNNSRGFTKDIFGPTSLRRNLILLRESQINDKLAALHTILSRFSDSAHKVKSNHRSYFMQKDNTPHMKAWNNVIKK